jgi:hypothetical protein
MVTCNDLASPSLRQRILSTSSYGSSSLEILILVLDRAVQITSTSYLLLPLCFRVLPAPNLILSHHDPGEMEPQQHPKTAGLTSPADAASALEGIDIPV